MTTSTALAEVADILPGISIPGRIEDQPFGAYQVILPRHVSDDGQPIVYSAIADENRVSIELDHVANDRRLQVGDILFMSRGERNRACLIVEPPHDGMGVAPNVFHLIRPKPGKIVPAYLAWFLNQVSVQAVIKREIRTSSVATPMVPRGDFGKLAVALPSAQRQQQIADLGALMLREQFLRRRLADLCEQRNAALGTQLLNQTSTTGMSL